MCLLRVKHFYTKIVNIILEEAEHRKNILNICQKEISIFIFFVVIKMLSALFINVCSRNEKQKKKKTSKKTYSIYFLNNEDQILFLKD